MKPEFEKLLGDDKDKFIENCKEFCKKENRAFVSHMKALDREINFIQFVSRAFFWDETDRKGEGVTFWSNIANRDDN